MQNKLKIIIIVCFIFVFNLTGCSIENTDRKKIKDIDFTVVDDSEVPEELIGIIDKKKVDNFKVTFSTEKFLYIVVGYGKQNTNGYSIAVEELYLSSNAIYIKTNLIGPAKGDVISQVKSYPYVIVKIKSIDKNVVFE